MTKQELFYRQIISNDIQSVVNLLTDPSVQPQFDHNRAIQLASQHGWVDIVKLLLKDQRVNPSVDANYSLIVACEHGHIEIVKLLLSDKKTNPSQYENYPIIKANAKRHNEIVQLLWDDKRVKETLKVDCLDTYLKLIKQDLENKINEFN